jgi:hypothetical protein
MDANFRLQRNMTSSRATDPGLSKGYSYFTEDLQYRDYLAPRMAQAQEVVFSFLHDDDVTEMCHRRVPVTATVL